MAHPALWHRWLPPRPPCSHASVVLPGSQSCWWLDVVTFPLVTLVVTVPAGTGFATQPFPIQCLRGPAAEESDPTCPCLQLLLCPSREHAPARGTQQHLFPHPVVVLWERLKLLSKNLERAFTSIFCLQQTCDLQCVVIGENKAS